MSNSLVVALLSVSVAWPVRAEPVAKPAKGVDGPQENARCEPRPLRLAAHGALAPDSRTTATRYLAFGPQGSTWVLVEVATRRIERLALPAEDIDGLAVSADGSRFAYIGPTSKGQPGVWSWKRGDAFPRLIESGAGKYSDPAIAPDESIYFSRSPVNGRSHIFGTYAQIFRIRPDGTGLQQITNEDGCHFGISFTTRARLQYIHSSCTAQSWVERIGTTTKPEVVASVVGSLVEATTAPDGDSTLFVSDEPDSFVVHESNKNNPGHDLLAIDRRMRRVRVGYGRSSNEIFYQQGGNVWLLDHGIRTCIAAMKREEAR